MADLNVHKDLIDQFKLIDVDNSGVITVDELRDVLIKMTDQEVTEEEVNRIIEEVDNETNGTINYTEFLAATIP